MIIITSTAKQTMRNSNVFLAIAGFSTTTTTAFAPFLGNSRGTLETKTLSAAWQHVQTTTCRASTTRTSTSLRATMPSLSSHCEDDLPLAREAMAFIDASPDPFHVVKKAVEKLEEVGFVEWSDDEEIENGGKYYFTRNKSTLVAFSIGQSFKPGNGFKIIGSHTDSPNLKVKPHSKRTTTKNGGASGAIQLGVECYGGGLWHTWFDRDLGISGRVFVNDEEKGTIRQELVKIDRPILRIPNLAIHLQTAKEREAFEVNKEDHLSPILAMAVKDSLSGGSTDDDSAKDEWQKNQEPLLVHMLSAELGVALEDIVDFELNLFDVQTASLGGLHSEFVHSARLDNLASCFLSLRGLIDHVKSGGVQNDEDISMIAMFDHEEVGSSSATGAGSPIIGEAMKRINHALGAGVDPILYDRAIRRSFVLSVDQAHAVHPNYASKHEKNHGPVMNGGMVIKRNANQRYATNGVTGLIIRQLAKHAGLPPIQEFVVRNDCGCGSTIGPVISTATGMRAIDMGCPQLSMHSIRETMGVKDFTHGLALFKTFFSDFSTIDRKIKD
jgi:aspartyl aminopeptidase